MSNISKGGRGKRAPYKTVMCRTPEPIKSIAEALTGRYRELVDNYYDPEDPELIANVLAGVIPPISNNSSNNSTEELSSEVNRLKEELKYFRETIDSYIDQKIQWYEALEENPILKTQILQLQEENLQLKERDGGIISNSISEFIEIQKKNYGKNGTQKDKEFTLNTRKWDAFREFQKFIEQ